MKYAILCGLFAPIIYLALRQKKWYLYLLFAFYAVLPEQLSIKLHESIPLVSASRVLIVVFMAFWLYDKWKTKRFRFPKSLMVFLGISLIVSLVNLRYGGQEIKRMFLLIFERALLVIMVADTIESREEFDRCVDFTIMGCCVMAVMGLSQTIFGYNIASALHLTETVTSFVLSDRMGLTRAYATMNAISYGCYCAFMVLPIYYRLQGTGKKRYSLAFALNMVALIATFTRSAWLCIAGIIFLVFLTRPLKMLRSLWPSVVLIVVLCIGFGFVQPKFGAGLLETTKSAYNTVVKVLPEEWFYEEPTTEPTVEPTTEPTVEPTTEPTEPAPTEPRGPELELDKNFGDNANDPTYSRMAQWTAVDYMIDDGQLLFGYGYNALQRGKICFFFDRWFDGWMVSTFLDVGLVAVITESGLIGTIAHLGLFAFMLLQALRKKERKGAFDFYKLIIFTVPLYLLLNFLAAYVNDGAVWLIIGLFYAYERLREKEMPAPALPENKD